MPTTIARWESLSDEDIEQQPGGIQPRSTRPPGYGRPLQEEASGPDISTLGGRPMPPQGYVVPRFEERDSWEEDVYNLIQEEFGIPGGNPFLYNVEDVIKEADRRLPELFERVFPGMWWGDRETMTKDQAEFWNREVQKYHRTVYDTARARKEAATEAYNFMMNKFDNRAKAFQAAMEKEQEREMQLQRNPPDPKIRINPRTNKPEWYRFDMTKRQWVSTGKEAEWSQLGKGKNKNVTQGPSRADLIAVMKEHDRVFKNLMESGRWKDGDKLPDEILDRLNSLRESVGLPKLAPRVELKTVKSYWDKVLGGEGEDKAVFDYPEEWSPGPETRKDINERAAELMKEHNGDKKKVLRILAEEGY